MPEYKAITTQPNFDTVRSLTLYLSVGHTCIWTHLLVMFIHSLALSADIDFKQFLWLSDSH